MDMMFKEEEKKILLRRRQIMGPFFVLCDFDEAMKMKNLSVILTSMKTRRGLR